MTDYTIPREVIARVFPVPRDTYAFERLTSRFGEVEANSTVAVAATNALADATFVTLSANAELPNERVLQFGTGLAGQLTDTTITLGLTNAVPRVTGGDRLTFEVTAQSVLEAPATGFLATREWVIAQGYGSGGGGGYTIATASTSYTETATSGDKITKITASGQTVTLPTAVGNTARLTYKLMVAGTFTVDGAGAETIDGAATYGLTAQYETVTIVSDNANWLVI